MILSPRAKFLFLVSVNLGCCDEQECQTERESTPRENLHFVMSVSSHPVDTTFDVGSVFMTYSD